MSKKVSVLGAGSWGTALACVMARKGFDILLWGRDSNLVVEINTTHKNTKYLDNINLEKSIAATNNFEKALAHGELILVVTPAQSIRDIAGKISKVNSDAPIIVCAKGIDRETGKLPAESLLDVMPEREIAALSGPSFSTDVASGKPTAVTLAAQSIEKASEISAELSDPAFRLYANDDVKGVELGGALKNVIALAIGVCRGLQLGASAEAALIARGFAELTRLATKIGAKPNTLIGLSGLGDLVLTCSSTQSRNFSYGIELGKGNDLSGLALAEGAFTAEIAAKIAGDHDIECPIIETVANLVSRNINPKQAVELLMARPLKQEQH